MLERQHIDLLTSGERKRRVKLLDFGIAARTESADAAREQKLTQQGMVLGTPPYMSPEQFTGKSLDARSDIYSLGVMTYEMATGRLPFQAETPWQWATEHMMSQPAPFEATPVAGQIPAPMRAAILRALSKNKEDRQSSVTAFYEELAGLTAAPAAGAHTGTAQMAAPPVFDSPGPAKTAAMPSPFASGPSTAQAVATAVPIPQRRAAGTRGWSSASRSVGGLLLIGMAVVGVRSMKSSAPDDAPPAQAAPPVATVAPTPVAPVDTTPVQTATATPEQAAVPVQPEPVAHAAAAHTTTTTTATHASTTTESKPPVAEKPKPPSGNPCEACVAAAGSGNFTAAASAYNSCTDSAERVALLGHDQEPRGQCRADRGFQRELRSSAGHGGGGAVDGRLRQRVRQGTGGLQVVHSKR